MEETTVLARGTGPLGETLLRRRGADDGAVLELVVNGVFTMDSRETSSERALAGFARGVGSDAVLVGGLGLGYTAAGVLDRLDTRGRLDVVELDPHLVDWAHDGVTPLLGRVAQDPRTLLHVADVGHVLRGQAEPAGPWSAILLDVDNGPDFLIHTDNSDLYGRPTLTAALSRLVPGGVLAVWCQGPAPALLTALRDLDPGATEHRYTVTREGRRFTYVIYTAGPTAPPPPEVRDRAAVG